jgi:hypothetical protein
MANIPNKPDIGLVSKGIEVVGGMDTKVRNENAHVEHGVKHMEFDQPPSVLYTGKDTPKPKEEPEEPKELEEEEPTKQEDVEENLLELRKMMGMETKADKEAAEKEPEPEVVEEDEQVEEEPKEPEEPQEVVEEEPPKGRLRKREPAPSMEDMARLAGQAAAEALKQSDKVSMGSPEIDVPTLDDDDQVTYDIFTQMEKTNPDKYRGMKKKFSDFVDVSKSYQKQWLVDNPGEEFDPESGDHAEFYEKNEPKYSSADFKKAEKRVDMADVLGEVEKKYQDRIDDLEDRISRRTESQPKAKESADDAIKEMVKQVSPELGEILNDKGLEEAEKSDPLVYDKISQGADTLSVLVYEIEQNKGDNGLFAPNSRNDTHKFVSDFIKNKEAYVKNLPSSSQTWNGRAFSTNTEYNRMSKSDRQRHWTIDSNLLKAELIKDISQRVNGDIEQSREMLERYGVPSATKKTQSKKGGTPKKTNKPESPESSTEAVTAPNLTTGTDELKTPEKELADLMWG